MHLEKESQQELQRMVSWIIMFVAVLVAVLLLSETGQGFSAQFAVFRTRFLGIFIEAVPFLLLGAAVSGLIGAFVTADSLAAYLPRNRYMATTTGAMLGFVFPVCECGVVPVARRLINKGMPPSMAISFLLAAPFMNPVVFAATYTAFGFGQVFFLRFIVTLIVAVTVGLLFAAFGRTEKIVLPQHLAAIRGASVDVDHVHVDTSHIELKNTATIISKLQNALHSAIEDFFDMARYLIIGCILAALMQTVIPQGALQSLGSGNISSVLTLQATAFILSVCSTVDSFLALAFVGTFSTGSIVAFLTFGPMVDIKSTMMFLGVFPRRVVAILIALPFAMTFMAGVLINLFLV
ncbi:MAG: permease, partial [Chloroflexota bacterium]